MNAKLLLLGGVAAIVLVRSRRSSSAKASADVASDPSATVTAAAEGVGEGRKFPSSTQSTRSTRAEADAYVRNVLDNWFGDYAPARPGPSVKETLGNWFGSFAP